MMMMMMITIKKDNDTTLYWKGGGGLVHFFFSHVKIFLSSIPVSAYMDMGTCRLLKFLTTCFDKQEKILPEFRLILPEFLDWQNWGRGPGPPSLPPPPPSPTPMP